MNKNEYNEIHVYIRKNKPKKQECEHCFKSKKLDCALITGKKHERNIDNYIYLCRKCHYHYDHPNGISHSLETKIKIGIASKERILKNGININFVYGMVGKKHKNETIEKMSKSKLNNHPYSKKVINTKTNEIYTNIKEASEKNNIKYNCLSAMLRGQNPNKTNLIWKID